MPEPQPKPKLDITSQRGIGDFERSKKAIEDAKKPEKTKPKNEETK